jgi:endonuclease YncB( thermonuclease family)
MTFFRSIPLSTIIILVSTTALHAWTGNVVSIIDGDTIQVNHDGKQVAVHFYGISTPQKTQAFGNKATKMTTAFLAGKTVEVSILGTDFSGHPVGLVTVDGKNINRTLVETGYAWIYDQYCRQSFCGDWKGLELKARSAKLGLWQNSAPIPPWEWQGDNRFITGKTKQIKSTNSNLLGVGPAGQK